MVAPIFFFEQAMTIIFTTNFSFETAVSITEEARESLPT